MTARAACGALSAMQVYLASTSPRRRRLLAAAGIEHRIVTPGPEPVADGTPRCRAVARARCKAEGASVDAVEPGLVVGVDTVVDVDGRELGKPADAAAAAAMLRQLLGRDHLVHTAICVRRYPARDDADWTAVASSTVRFGPGDERRVAAHAASEAWRGKAGGYGIQDPEMADLATLVSGEFDTVVGLPIATLLDLLARARGGPA